MISTSSKRKRWIIVHGSVTRYGSQYQLVNLLRCNNVPRTLRIFCSKIAIFSQFSICLSITQAKQIINLLLLNNFYPVISTSSKRKRRIIVQQFGHSLWSAYQLPAQGVNLEENFSEVWKHRSTMRRVDGSSRGVSFSLVWTTKRIKVKRVNSDSVYTSIMAVNTDECLS